VRAWLTFSTRAVSGSCAAIAKGLLTMVRVIALCVGLFLSMGSSAVHAQVLFNAETATLSLNGKMQFIADDTNRFSLQDTIQAQREGHMQPLAGILNRGYAPVISWLSFVVTNDGAALVSPTLVLSPPFLDEVDVYVGVGDNPAHAEKYAHYAVGDHEPVTALALPSALMMVPLPIEQGVSLRIFIRVHSFSTHRLTAELVSQGQLVAKSTHHISVHSAYCAIALVSMDSRIEQ